MKTNLVQIFRHKNSIRFQTQLMNQTQQSFPSYSQRNLETCTA